MIWSGLFLRQAAPFLNDGGAERRSHGKRVEQLKRRKKIERRQRFIS
jgi:hypothetical protein